jgi:hypothetical protein
MRGSSRDNDKITAVHLRVQRELLRIRQQRKRYLQELRSYQSASDTRREKRELIHSIFRRVATHK